MSEAESLKAKVEVKKVIEPNELRNRILKKQILLLQSALSKRKEQARYYHAFQQLAFEAVGKTEMQKMKVKAWELSKLPGAVEAGMPLDEVQAQTSACG